MTDVFTHDENGALIEQPTRERAIERLAKAHVRQDTAAAAFEVARQELEAADQELHTAQTALRKMEENEVWTALEALR